MKARVSASGTGGHVENITVQGDVAGRDIVHIAEELSYDVSELSANPYRGMASFTYENRAFYGGREQQISEAVAVLTDLGAGLVFVPGASGSAKSSFAQAGVLPALEAHFGGNIKWAVTRPGRHPLAAIERALNPQPTVLVLDQFEELFTQAEVPEREQVLKWLGTIEKLLVIATLRADYLPALFDRPFLLKSFKEHGIELRAMDSSELARAIRQPLLEQSRRDRKDKRWQAALVERLVEDVGSDSTLLPLLQVTCTSLWDERRTDWCWSGSDPDRCARATGGAGVCVRPAWPGPTRGGATAVGFGAA